MISSRPWHKLWWDDLVVLCSNLLKKSYGVESNELSLAEHLHGAIHFFEFYKKNLELLWILNIAKRMVFLRNTNLNARVREYSYGILFLGTNHIIPESPGCHSRQISFHCHTFLCILFTWYQNDILFPYKSFQNELIHSAWFSIHMKFSFWYEISFCYHVNWKGSLFWKEKSQIM